MHHSSRVFQALCSAIRVVALLTNRKSAAFIIAVRQTTLYCPSYYTFFQVFCTVPFCTSRVPTFYTRANVLCLHCLKNTVKRWVQSQGSPCGICCEQSGTGTSCVVLCQLRFPQCSMFVYLWRTDGQWPSHITAPQQTQKTYHLL